MLAVAAVACALVAPAAAQQASVKVTNQSKWEIHHMYVSPSADEAWGPDQLGEEVLAKGDSMTVTGISCDSYDVLVVDEDGDECTIEQVDFCRDNSFWRITNADLLACEGFE